jgi:hypothetical protein
MTCSESVTLPTLITVVPRFVSKPHDVIRGIHILIVFSIIIKKFNLHWSKFGNSRNKDKKKALGYNLKST